MLGLLAAVLIALGVANMAAVDLYLLPAALFGDSFSVKGLPLAVVILAAVLMGILAGLVLEFLRSRSSLPEKTVPFFKAGKELRERMNGKG